MTGGCCPKWRERLAAERLDNAIIADAIHWPSCAVGEAYRMHLVHRDDQDLMLDALDNIDPYMHTLGNEFSGHVRGGNLAAAKETLKLIENHMYEFGREKMCSEFRRVLAVKVKRRSKEDKA